MDGDSPSSGFAATGIFPFDRNEVLKRLPGANKDDGGLETSAIVSDSVLDILKEYCGIGVEPNEQQQKRQRGPKAMLENV